MSIHWQKNWRLYVFVGLFLATLFLRLPFLSEMPFHQDTFLYMRGLENYEISNQAPHAPGYPLYIGVGKLTNFLINDTHQSLVIISLLAGALTPSLIFVVAWKLFKRKDISLLAAGVALTTPLLWFYSEIGLNYSLSSFMVLLLVYLLLLAREQQSWKWALLATITLGLIGGIRPGDMIFLLPLWVFSLWFLKISHKFWAGVCLFITVLAWLLPIVIINGGLAHFLELNQLQNDAAVTGASIFNGCLGSLVFNMAMLFESILSGIFAFLILVLLSLFVFSISGKKLFKKLQLLFKAKIYCFLLIWILPVTIFMVLFISRPGYLMLIAPAILIFLALVVAKLLRKTWLRKNPKSIPLWLTVIFLTVSFSNIIFMFCYSDSATISHLNYIKEDTNKFIQAVRQNFPPEETILFSSLFLGQEWSRDKAAYFFPDYYLYTTEIDKAVWYPPEKENEGFFGHQRFYTDTISLPGNTKQLILFNTCEQDKRQLVPNLVYSQYSVANCHLKIIEFTPQNLSKLRASVSN